MKLHLLDRSSLNDCSFTIKNNNYPNFLKVWHFHPEIELVYIKSSRGTRFIGDSIEKFEEGEIVLIGENLPHMWLNNDEYFEEASKLVAKAVAIHFKDDFLGSTFFQVPEMKHISKLFDRAKLGIKFLNIDKQIYTKINQMLSLDGFEKTMVLINVLSLLAKHNDFRLLASQGSINSFKHIDNVNMVKTFEYVYENFTNTIYLEDVANVINMNPASFSRFFKRVNRKTFSKFLNEVRIGFACKLMMEKSKDITSICFESGFNNISNFNRQFKNIKGMSPSEYIKLHHFKG